MNGRHDPVPPKAELNYNPVYFAGFYSMYLTTGLGLVLIENPAIVYIHESFRAAKYYPF